MANTTDAAAALSTALRERRRRPAEHRILAERATDVASQARQFRAAISRRERQAVRETLDAWIGVRRRLIDDIDTLTKALADLTARSGTPSRGQVLRLRQLGDLLDAVSVEVARFGRAADRITWQARRDAVAMAQDHTGALIDRQLGRAGVDLNIGFRPAATAATEAIVGVLGSGPVHDLLVSLGAGLTDRLVVALTDGLARGRSPRRVARDLRRISGIPRHRALAIARTETLRAYRESARVAHAANTDLLQGWQWLATLDTTTCPVCVAMHGTMLPAGEVQGTHPNCRCTALPVTRTWVDLGFPDVPESRTVLPPGTDWFATLDSDAQRQILGPAKHDAYRRGSLALTDLVGYRDHPQWGPTRFELPLSRT